MSLPVFSTQTELFSTAGLAGQLFGETDRYRLFAQKIFPVLARARPQLAKCYCADDGRAATEPVLLLGVTYLQYLEGLPDRQAVEMLRYHAGWNFALNRQVGDPLFHPTTLVNLRRREQQTEGFKERMKHRNAIEGTQSELVRAHGLRWARYRGLAKVKLQNYFAGAACVTV